MLPGSPYPHRFHVSLFSNTLARGRHDHLLHFGACVGAARVRGRLRGQPSPKPFHRRPLRRLERTRGVLRAARAPGGGFQAGAALRQGGPRRHVVDVLLGSLFILTGDARPLGRRGAVAEARVLLLLAL